MSNFIKAKGQRSIVNLDKVTNIRPVTGLKDPYKYNKTRHKIVFQFDSISEYKSLYEEWYFEDKDEYDKVVSFLEGVALEVL